MKDSFYTPEKLANHLISYIGKRNVNSVADFCVGDGELLRAATKKWPNAHFSGTDISPQVIRLVKKNHPIWSIGKCDFLDEKSRQKSNVLRLKNEYDLILLNPPFSCIGPTRNKVLLNGKVFNASTAMTFLVNAINYLSKKGNIYAILPASVAYSQKDRKLWEELVEKYKLSVLEEPDTQYFPDCSARIIIVSLNTSRTPKVLLKVNRLDYNIRGLSIFRGNVRMHTLNGNSRKGDYLIHSTNLQNNQIVDLIHKSDFSESSITGPAILIHRVGLPKVGKVCFLPKDVTYAISDCIIAIKAKSDKDAVKLKTILLANYDELAKLYKGTGAKYITIERLEQFLGLRLN